MADANARFISLPLSLAELGDLHAALALAIAVSRKQTDADAAILVPFIVRLYRLQARILAGQALLAPATANSS